LQSEPTTALHVVVQTPVTLKTRGEIMMNLATGLVLG